MIGGCQVKQILPLIIVKLSPSTDRTIGEPLDLYGSYRPTVGHT